jgi:hypothetical protein
MREELAAAAITKGVPASSGAVGMVLLGVPQGVLIAAFMGAILSFYFQQGTTERRIPRLIFGVVSLAFAGAWISLALPHVDFLHIGTMAGKVDAAVRAGLCALAFQSLWNLGHKLADRKAEGR